MRDFPAIHSDPPNWRFRPRAELRRGPDRSPLLEIDCLERTSQVGVSWELLIATIGSTVSAATGTDNVLALRVREHLCRIVGQATPITYQALAKVLHLSPPNTIHQLTVALECLIDEDAAAARPLIAALVVSKARGGLPAPGFFDCVRRVGRFDGDPSGPESSAFHAAEFNKAVEFWSEAAEVVETDIQVRQPS